MNASAMSVKQLCTSFGICPATLYNHLKAGTGPTIFKIGRRTLISVAAAEDWRKHLERVTTTARAGV